MGPTWGPPGSSRPHMGPMLAHQPCDQGCVCKIETFLEREPEWGSNRFAIFPTSCNISQDFFNGPILFGVASGSIGESYASPNVSEITPDGMDKWPLFDNHKTYSSAERLYLDWDALYFTEIKGNVPIIYLYSRDLLTQWGRDKMAASFHTTFSNVFSWMKIFKFRLIFQRSLFPRVQLTIFHY